MAELMSIRPTLATDSDSAQELTSENVGAKGAYGLWTCMAWVTALRVVIFFVGAISIWTANEYSVDYATGRPWIAFDAVHYESVLRHGYQFDNENWKWIAYFPGYPLTARLLALVMPPAVAMLIVSNLCAVLGLGLFYVWAKEMLGARVSFISTLLLAAFPGAVFYSAGTSEAPFMMLTALTLLLMHRKQWYWAATACAVASFTRPTAAAVGIMLVVAFLIESTSIPWNKRLLRGACLGIICISGSLAYQAFLMHRTGDFEIYFKAQKMWEISDDVRRAKAAQLAAANPELVPPRHTIRFYLEKASTPQAWNRCMALGILSVSLYGLLRRSGVPRVLFIMPLVIFLLGYLPNNGLRASSVTRYEMASLPVFLAIGYWFARKPNRRFGLVFFVAACLLLQVYYAYCYSLGIWVG